MGAGFLCHRHRLSDLSQLPHNSAGLAPTNAHGLGSLVRRRFYTVREPLIGVSHCQDVAQVELAFGLCLQTKRNDVTPSNMNQENEDIRHHPCRLERSHRVWRVLLNQALPYELEPAIGNLGGDLREQLSFHGGEIWIVPITCFTFPMKRCELPL